MEQLQHPIRVAAHRADISPFWTQLYTVSYLILFSILGTLARLGLQALTNYPGPPVVFASVWPNFAGSLMMGFLLEDCVLFREASLPFNNEENPASAKQAHAAFKKTIPLYIGLATGFCGSLTSFSAFMRDAFLALVNDVPASSSDHRSGGHSFLALLAVPVVTLSLSLSAFSLGTHLAAALASFAPRLPTRAPSVYGGRLLLDRLAVLLGWGCWLGAVLLSALPPAGYASWRRDATLALVFAPLGCLARFYVSLWLNPRIATFPLGTFLINLVGTGLLALTWDLMHSGVVTVTIGCQLLSGVQDGFCGCLTTVSTWVAELSALKRKHAYVYGGASVLCGLVIVIVAMGALRWSGSHEAGAC
ncbi:CrcB-like protein-domain-containing protein [Corynascus novoguineensis]|uniref:CrcB-like protein-domain-containing protein n=1 Tax=Corynascus novoguineensis TaxID=1126955 RepID=A0AAN7D1L9_9PEZI|nr:CrcB-like protein-domain-containing protein [Corynascus novoguineensis]